MTARKTGPHAKRGPKPKPKPEKRSRGRPQVPLREHPDRYLLARYDVADTWLRKRLSGARTRAIAVRATGVEAVSTPRKLAEVLKTSENLRTMARRYRKPDDMKWRRAIAQAVGHTLIGAAVGGEPEPGRISLIMEYAAAAGEAEWVEREVLPLITLRPVAPDNGDPLMLLAGAVASIGWATDIRRLIAAQAPADDAQTGLPEIEGILRPSDRPFILPMSGKKSRFTIVGIHFTTAAFVSRNYSELRAGGRVAHVESCAGRGRRVASLDVDPAACTGMKLGATHLDVAALSDLRDLPHRSRFPAKLPAGRFQNRPGGTKCAIRRSRFRQRRRGPHGAAPAQNRVRSLPLLGKMSAIERTKAIACLANPS